MEVLCALIISSIGFALTLVSLMKVDRLEWQHCVVHPDSFQQMYDMFWAFKTHAERASFTPIAWLALLLIVMSHGLATMRPTDAKVSLIEYISLKQWADATIGIWYCRGYTTLADVMYPAVDCVREGARS